MPDIVSLGYSESGQGTPLVLLHGFPLSSVLWHEAQRQFSDRYRVITPDLRGHGRSPAPTGAYPMDLLARDLLALLDSLRINQAVLMGHSMGGYVTLAAWKRAPERFLALGLIASQAAADTDETRQGRYRLAEKVVESGSHVVADAMLPKLFATKVEADTPLYLQTRKMILDTSTRGIVGALQGMATRPDLGPELGSLEIPLLILSGDKDQIIPPEKAKAMAAAAPTATLAIIKNAGHLPMLEQPRATIDAIGTFMDTVNVS